MNILLVSSYELTHVFVKQTLLSLQCVSSVDVINYNTLNSLSPLDADPFYEIDCVVNQKYDAIILDVDSSHSKPEDLVQKAKRKIINCDLMYVPNTHPSTWFFLLGSRCSFLSDLDWFNRIKKETRICIKPLNGEKIRNIANHILIG